MFCSWVVERVMRRAGLPRLVSIQPDVSRPQDHPLDLATSSWQRDWVAYYFYDLRMSCWRKANGQYPNFPSLKHLGHHARYRLFYQGFQSELSIRLWQRTRFSNIYYELDRYADRFNQFRCLTTSKMSFYQLADVVIHAWLSKRPHCETVTSRSILMFMSASSPDYTSPLALHWLECPAD